MGARGPLRACCRTESGTVRCGTLVCLSVCLIVRPIRSILPESIAYLPACLPACLSLEYPVEYPTEYPHRVPPPSTWAESVAIFANSVSTLPCRGDALPIVPFRRPYAHSHACIHARHGLTPPNLVGTGLAPATSAPGLGLCLVDNGRTFVDVRCARSCSARLAMARPGADVVASGGLSPGADVAPAPPPKTTAPSIWIMTYIFIYIYTYIYIYISIYLYTYIYI
jgi:hypothetical protein